MKTAAPERGMRTRPFELSTEESQADQIDAELNAGREAASAPPDRTAATPNRPSTVEATQEHDLDGRITIGGGQGSLF